MLDTISIRRATEQDTDALMKLYDEFHLFHVQGVPDRFRAPEPSATEKATLREALTDPFRSFSNSSSAHQIEYARTH